MFEGLFSPMHLVIVAVVVFIAFGPRKIANRWHGAGERLRQLSDGETPGASEPGPEQGQPAPSAFYRLARRLRRRRR